MQSWQWSLCSSRISHDTERRAHTAVAAFAQKSPIVQLKVTVLPWAVSSHSMGRSQAVVLDHAADSEEESPFPETSQHHVMKGSPKKVWPDPMWEVIKWLEACIEILREEDVPWWPLVVPLTDEGAPGARELAKCFLATWQWMVEWSLPSFVCPPPLC